MLYIHRYTKSFLSSSLKIVGRPEPMVTWFNGSDPIHTAGGVAMGRHVIVNRLVIPNLSREAYNSTLRCLASNTKLAPPVERIVRIDMLRKIELNQWYKQYIIYLHIQKFPITIIPIPTQTQSHTHTHQVVIAQQITATFFAVLFNWAAYSHGHHQIRQYNKQISIFYFIEWKSAFH